MAMQDLSIKVDVQDGYEAIDFRVPVIGEMFIAACGSIMTSSQTGICPDLPRIILRRVTPWPSWLKAAAYAKDDTGIWWAYAAVPKRGSDGWNGSGDHIVRLRECFFDIPDPDVPWQDSLRINPSYKGDGGK